MDTYLRHTDLADASAECLGRQAKSHLHQALHWQQIARSDDRDFVADLAARTHARDALTLADLASTRLPRA